MKKPTAILTVFILLAVYGATASFQAKAALSKCATIDIPSLLLECYKQLTTEWMGKKTQIDKSKSSFVLIKSDLDSGWQLAATGLTNDRWERLNLRVYSKHFWVRSDDERDITILEDLRPSLWIRCINGKMTGFINWGIFLDVEKAKIVFRYDDEPVRVAIAQVSKDHKKIEALSEGRLISRIKEMFRKKRLAARVTPHGAKPLAVSFNISGLETAIKPLRKSCNW